MCATVKPASFTEHQARFTQYIRDPYGAPIPEGIEARRMDLYRELMVNNVESFLANCFPVLRRIMDPSAWNALAQDFFSRHRSKTPYFSGIPEEFLEYLQNERSEPDDFPFLLELAHYEWAEMALALAPDRELPTTVSEAASLETLNRCYRVSDLAWPLIYRFPVHRILMSFTPNEAPAEPTYLVVYRNSEDEVRFMEINAATWRLLQMFDGDPIKTAADCLIDLAIEIGHSDRTRILEYGKEIVESLAKRGILYPANES